MSTWVEIAEGTGIGLLAFSQDGQNSESRTTAPHDEKAIKPIPVPRGIGRGGHSFAQRLSRARLLYARRREALFNWLALSLAMFIVLAAPSVPV